MKLRINPDGSVVCLYRDTLPFLKGGRPTIQRASHVEFENTKQCWEILTPNYKLVESGFPTRQAAIDREIEILEGTL